jgi:hypothetical protein|tara:strand:+ start:3598 stop:3726 length:129 start_codon:yes stop_codon:yes gene_type:complete
MVEGEPLALGFTGPELIGLGVIGLVTYAVGKRMFKALSGENS